MSNSHFSGREEPKTNTCKHISTKFPNKLHVGTDVFTLDICLSWIWNQDYQLAFWIW